MAMGTALQSEKHLEWVVSTWNGSGTSLEGGSKHSSPGPELSSKDILQKGEASVLEEKVLGKPKINFLPPGRKGVKRPLSRR